ncbi:MAG TPA: TolC family protein, partial [Longimicrobium sp.]
MRSLLIPVALAAVLLPGAARAQRTLTLDEAVRTALAASPDVQRAEAASLRGQAGHTDAWTALLPRVTAQTGFNRSDVLQRTATDPVTGGTIALPDSLIRQRQSFGTRAGLSLDWTVFAGGRTLAAPAAARARERAAEHGVSAARVRAAADVAMVYLDALEAQALVDVRRAQDAHARELERTAQARYETGSVPEIDVLQARLASSEAQVALLEAESEARARRMELAERMGVSAGEVQALAAPDAPLAPDTAALRARLLGESPLL